MAAKARLPLSIVKHSIKPFPLYRRHFYQLLQRCNSNSPLSFGFVYENCADTTTESTESLTWENLLSNNPKFATSFESTQPDLLKALAAGQHPKVLWIGCADSRCPETTLLGARPGDVFVHRNIANVVRTSDVSANSVIDFAVWAVGVEKVVVCGHTACGGANASLNDSDLGEHLNGWLKPVRDLRKSFQKEIDGLEADKRADWIAEKNIKMSVDAVKENAKVKEKLAEGKLEVLGVIYDVRTAKIRVLDL
jgi:carbonic anhydrase